MYRKFCCTKSLVGKSYIIFYVSYVSFLMYRKFRCTKSLVGKYYTRSYDNVITRYINFIQCYTRYINFIQCCTRYINFIQDNLHKIKFSYVLQIMLHKITRRKMLYKITSPCEFNILRTIVIAYLYI